MVVDSAKIPYPKSVFFIITNEFCERFSYYGMKAVLTIYLKNVLRYTEDTATVIYHVFSMLCYFTPVFGAMIADSLLGKFKTILYLSLVYAIGNVVLSAAATPPLGLPIEAFSIIGLLLIAIGTGGIKPCVSAFGGDQFVLPQQAAQLASFFSIFYFSINAGSLLSTFITPIFRKDVKCFGSDTCYPLAFGVPAVLMIVSLLVFVIGYRWYSIKKPTGNITIDVCKCISTALREKARSTTKKDHWLDYASTQYDHELIHSVKQLLKVLLLYIPLPVFWALFDQQGSRWTFQATRMDGEVFGWTIKPDQMQVLNPFLILAFIPIFDQVIYPAFDKIGLLKKPLQRLTVGGILAGAAFIISGFVEISLEPTYAVKLAKNEAHLTFVNNINCTLDLQIGDQQAQIDGMGQYIIKSIQMGEYKAQISSTDACKEVGSGTFPLTAHGKEARTYFISSEANKLNFQQSTNRDILQKNGEGAALLKFIFVGFNANDKQKVSFVQTSNGRSLTVYEEHEPKEKDESGHGGGSVESKPMSFFPVPALDSAVYRVDPLNLTIQLSSEVDGSSELSLGTIKPRQGGNYVYVVKKENNGNYSIHEYVITQPNSIHILWLVPQYVVITIAEVMFSVTGLQFSYSQAPESMKSVVQAAWLLTVAFGNVIVVFLVELKIFESQSKEFFLYAGLMFVDIAIFAILAWFYVPHAPHSDKKDESVSPNNVEMKENKYKDDYNHEA